jgi:hypothetical protein
VISLAVHLRGIGRNGFREQIGNFALTGRKQID